MIDSARARRWGMYLVLYLWALFLFSIAHHIQISRDTGLWGEEIAVSYRDVYYFERRLQSDGYATSFSAHLFYLAASHIFPLSVQSMRWVKICTCATLSPLLALLMLCVAPRLPLKFAAIPGILFPLIPSMMFFSIFATENMLDDVFLIPLIVLAFELTFEWKTLKFWLRSGTIVIMTAWSLHLYGGAAAVILSVFLMLFARALTMPGGARKRASALMCVALLTLTSVAASSWPKVWIKGEHASVVGGGRLDRETFIALFDLVAHPFRAAPCLESNSAIICDREAMIRENLYYTKLDFFERSATYQIAGTLSQPAFPWFRGGFLVIALAALGLLYIKRSPRLGWIIITGLIALGVGIIAGPVPGIRRMVVTVMMVCMLCAIGLYIIARIPWCQYRLGRALSGLLALIVVAFGAVNFWDNLEHWKVDYQAWLARDFVQMPGLDYAQTFDLLLYSVQQKPQTIALKDYSSDTLVMLALFCERQNIRCFPPTVVTGDRSYDTRITPLDAVFVK